MALKVYNTKSRNLEEFIPIQGNRVRMFVCGPTVYDHSHIGHARTYLAYDIIARYLRAKDYSVFYLMNITDVDDKIINKASSISQDPLTLASEFTEEFLQDIKALGIESVNLYAKASEHIPEIIDQISTLISRGSAYRVDGDVYFDVSSFPDYGQLSRQDINQLVMHRIDPDPRKRNIIDFALWKSQKPQEPAWDSPWGKGRPGWHIEDTAITATYFGPSYDLHGGGLDLIFPHHEAEIA
ncbi:MAG: class I tRNA ligase family protein, partial [Candidatus Bathyarchaeia archaeon]